MKPYNIFSKEYWELVSWQYDRNLSQINLDIYEVTKSIFHCSVVGLILHSVHCPALVGVSNVKSHLTAVILTPVFYMSASSWPFYVAILFFWFGCVHLDLLETSLLYSGMENFPSESQRLIVGDLLDIEITSWRMVVLNYNWFLRVDFLVLLAHRADERFTHLTLDWFMRLKSLSLHSYFKHLLPFLYKQPVQWYWVWTQSTYFLYHTEAQLRASRVWCSCWENTLLQTCCFCRYGPLELSKCALPLLPW